MRITVNGEPRELPEGTTVARALEVLEVRRELVAVELNQEVVPRGRHQETVLSEGDRMEVVSFTGGG